MAVGLTMDTKDFESFKKEFEEYSEKNIKDLIQEISIDEIITNKDISIEEIEQDGAIYVDPAKSWIIQKEKDYYFIFSGKIIPISEYDAESLVKEGFSLRN